MSRGKLYCHIEPFQSPIQAIGVVEDVVHIGKSEHNDDALAD